MPAESAYSNPLAPPDAADVGKKGKTTGVVRKKTAGKSKNEDEDELKRILKNYRDRAKERREGEEKTVESQGDMLKLQATAGYRAVAPDDSLGAAERRKQMIHESKYLGGDMEHTHLVKGLDYALLQKVRSEITHIEQEDETLESAFQAHHNEQKEVESQIKNPLARSIYHTIFGGGPAAGTSVGANELFAPRRMAYVMDVEDELAEDIPTTLIRSKADCPQDETSTNLNTNDVVIQKLTQVLSYLRADKRKRRTATTAPETAPSAIYDDVGEYEPSRERRNAAQTAGRDESRHWECPPRRSGNYFPDSGRNRDERRDNRESRENRDRRGAVHDGRREREDRERYERRSGRERRDEDRQRREVPAKAEAARDTNKPRREDILKLDPPPESGVPITGISSKEPIGYDECYPSGYDEMMMGGDDDDSEEEVDWSQMDPGTKRGPVGRKDFETEEDYNKWRAKRASMPKSAYQYGLKMSEGRKTKKTGGLRNDKDAERHEKQKLDRQWTQISKILAKRKDMESGGGGDDAKRAKR